MFEYFPCSTSVLSRQYCSTSPSVLQYFHGSTVVLRRQYFSTAKEVLGLDKSLSISSFLSEYNHRLFHQSVVAVLKVQVLSLGR